ncbi:MAG: ankyrin repeat domain-containing protein [Gammaproteobacteria bacterium]
MGKRKPIFKKNNLPEINRLRSKQAHADKLNMFSQKPHQPTHQEINDPQFLAQYLMMLAIAQTPSTNVQSRRSSNSSSALHPLTVLALFILLMPVDVTVKSQILKTEDVKNDEKFLYNSITEPTCRLFGICDNLVLSPQFQSQIPPENIRILNVELARAIRDDKIKMAEEAITLGADVNGNVNGIRLLEGAVGVFLEDKNNREQSFQIVQLLLENGADPNLVADDGYNSFHMAAKYGNVEMLKLLHKYGANMYAITKLKHKNVSAFHLAALEGHYQAVKLFLEEWNIDVNFGDVDKVTALHLAVHSNRYQIVKELLAHGADINIRTIDQGDAPLHVAALGDHVEIVKLLLDSGARINLKNFFNLTPLLLAVKQGCIRTVKLMFDRGADYRIRDGDGLTPIHWAAELNYPNIVELLCQKFSVVNELTAEGNVPLYFAARNGYIKIVETLLERGANPNSADQFGITPLYIAAKKGHTKVVILLLKSGADATAKDIRGETAWEIAKAMGQDAVAKILQSHIEQMHDELPTLLAQRAIIAGTFIIVLFHLAYNLNSIWNNVLNLLWNNKPQNAGEVKQIINKKLLLFIADILTIEEIETESKNDVVYKIGKFFPGQQEIKNYFHLTQITVSKETVYKEMYKILDDLGVEVQIKNDGSKEIKFDSFLNDGISKNKLKKANSAWKHALIKASKEYNELQMQQLKNESWLQELRQQPPKSIEDLQHNYNKLKLAFDDRHSEMKKTIALLLSLEEQFQQYAMPTEQILKNPRADKNLRKFAADISGYISRNEPKIKNWIEEIKQKMANCSGALESLKTRLTETIAMEHLPELSGQVNQIESQITFIKSQLFDYEKETNTIIAIFAKKQKSFNIAQKKSAVLNLALPPQEQVAAQPLAVVLPPPENPRTNINQPKILKAAAFKQPNKKEEIVAESSQKVLPSSSNNNNSVPPESSSDSNNNNKNSVPPPSIQIIINSLQDDNYPRFFSKQKQKIPENELPISLHSQESSEFIATKVKNYALAISARLTSLEQYNLSMAGEPDILRYSLTYNITRFFVALWELDYRNRQEPKTFDEQREKHIRHLWRHMLAHLPDKANENDLISFGCKLREQFLDNLLATSSSSSKKASVNHQRMLKLFSAGNFTNSDLYHHLKPGWDEQIHKSRTIQECLAGLNNAIETFNHLFKVIQYPWLLDENPDRCDALKMLIAIMQDYYGSLAQNFPEVVKEPELVLIKPFLSPPLLRNKVFHEIDYADIDNEILDRFGRQLSSEGMRPTLKKISEWVKDAPSSSSPKL